MIVIVILGILAAVVVPKFVGASDSAKLDALRSQLQMVRSQLELYRFHHGETYPTGINQTFKDQLTQYTASDHTTSVTKNIGTGHVFGPYLKNFPNNPFTQTSDVTTGGAGVNKAWYYNPATGEFRTNDTVHDGL